MNVIGEFKEFCNDSSLESIKENISEYPYENKDTVLKYLRSGETLGIAPQVLKDVITGESMSGELKLMSDGKHRWRSDLAYYVEKYNLRLPKEFEEYCLKHS